ncbi:MAG: FxsA family protein [Actinomycetota bacterium]|nr:FxsA family protein [Actinomycetota bacterium]
MGFKGRLLFFGYPLAEILVLWGVASLIGWGWALLGILAGIPIGFALMRNAGASAAGLMQANAAGDQQRAMAMASSMTGQFVAGVLIAIPGYLTDLIGLALLLPGVRGAIGRRMMSRYRSSPWMSRMPGSGPIIQGTVIVEDLRYEDGFDSGSPNPGEDEPPAITR